jgi:DNA-binding MarR family transcriptional regulator
MSEIPGDLAAMDRVIHEPARLAILTALSAVANADFLFLQQLIGLTAGNLSSHLTKLEEGGLVWIEKAILNKRTHTQTGLTERGRQAIERHWQQLDALRQHAQAAGNPK